MDLVALTYVQYTQGFGIYGFGDFSGEPVLDECHGHFGLIPGGGVSYHYHASGVTNLKGTPHRPYYMGCQGPSKSKCNTTVAWKYDYGVSNAACPTLCTHSHTLAHSWAPRQIGAGKDADTTSVCSPAHRRTLCTNTSTKRGRWAVVQPG